MSKEVKTLQNYILALGGKLPKYGADGDMGAETRSAIVVLPIPNYVKTALLEVGVHEIAGIKNNPRVLEYHATTGKYSNDEVPWCGSFVAWVFIQNAMRPVDTAERAKSWSTLGKKLQKPTLGAIAVKSRKGGGHVCIVIGQNKNGDLYCVGGNQNDSVNITLYKKDVFEEFRLPMHTEEVDLPAVDLTTSMNVREA